LPPFDRTPFCPIAARDKSLRSALLTPLIFMSRLAPRASPPARVLLFWATDRRFSRCSCFVDVLPGIGTARIGGGEECLPIVIAVHPNMTVPKQEAFLVFQNPPLLFGHAAHSSFPNSRFPSPTPPPTTHPCDEADLLFLEDGHFEHRLSRRFYCWRFLPWVYVQTPRRHYLVLFFCSLARGVPLFFWGNCVLSASSLSIVLRLT